MLADLVSPLYAIANFPSGPGLSATSVTTAMLAGGVGVVQLRAKGESAEQRRARALEMGPLCENAGVPLVINDDLELAFSGLPGIRACIRDKATFELWRPIFRSMFLWRSGERSD